MAADSDIPIVDLEVDLDLDSDFFSPPTASDLMTASRLVAAARSHGFVFIRTGVPDSPSVIRAFELSTALFESPLHDKARCAIGKDNRGWSGLHTETLDPPSQRMGDIKEAFNFGQLNSPPLQPLPGAVDNQRGEIDAFRVSCHLLCLRILYLLGVGLGVDPPHFLADAHRPSAGPSGSILRFLRYPSLADSPGISASEVRAGAHSDYGSITLLFRLRGQGGLQILTRDDSWAPVPVNPPGTEADDLPPILVNVGDLLQYWTDGRLRSTVHRVVFDPDDPGTPRYSIAYFCHPADHTPIGPVPLIPPAGSPRAPPIAVAGAATASSTDSTVMTAREHLMMKLAATYGSIYKETD